MLEAPASQESETLAPPARKTATSAEEEAIRLCTWELLGHYLSPLARKCGSTNRRCARANYIVRKSTAQNERHEIPKR